MAEWIKRLPYKQKVRGSSTGSGDGDGEGKKRKKI